MNSDKIWIIALSVALTALALTASTACAKKRAHVKKAKAAKAAVASAGMNVKDKKIASFRYERYDHGKSVVYYASRSTHASSFYYRLFGENVGWTYEIDTLLLGKLEAQLPQFLNGKFKQLPFDKEDKKRDRWQVEIKFATGEVFSTVQYETVSSSASASSISAKMDDVFLAEVHRLAAEEVHKGDFTKSVYNADGTLDHEIYYTPDGVVHGGYDPEDPMKEY